MIAGVDGLRDGWVAVLEDFDGRRVVRNFGRLGALLALTELKVLVIDVPIGLMNAGTRLADQEARQLLGRRARCVFTAPIRPVLAASSREEASAIWRRLEGKGCTCQLWAIVPKIREVDGLMRDVPTLQQTVREGHPEISFATLNGGPALAHGKKTPAGQACRLELLGRCFPDVQGVISAKPKWLRNDIIDAYTMLWTAHRIIAGRSRKFPETDQRDPYGLRAQIVA